MRGWKARGGRSEGNKKKPKEINEQLGEKKANVEKKTDSYFSYRKPQSSSTSHELTFIG